MAEEDVTTQQFSLSEEDLWAGSQIHTRKNSSLSRVIFACATLVVLVVGSAPFILAASSMVVPGTLTWHLLSAFYDLRCLVWPLAGVLVVQFLLYPYFSRRSLRSAYVQDKELYENIQVRIAADGIDTSCPNYHCHRDWSWYKSAIESKLYFVAAHGTAYSLIPKRALSAADAARVSELLRRHIAKYEIRN
jgi:hypothetical protein